MQLLSEIIESKAANHREEIEKIQKYSPNSGEIIIKAIEIK